MLRFLNIVLLQWFFIRLTGCQQRIITGYKMFECSIVGPGQFAVAGDYEYSIEQWYSIQGWILPLTGWRNDFRNIGNPWIKKVSKPCIIDKLG
jgi:hypothetical protein